LQLYNAYTLYLLSFHEGASWQVQLYRTSVRAYGFFVMKELSVRGAIENKRHGDGRFV
jgi:hypothetical protein